MESLSNYLTFSEIDRGEKPKEGYWLWKRTKKGTGEGSYSEKGIEEKPVKVLDSKTGTENQTESGRLEDSPRYSHNLKFRAGGD